MKIYQKSVVRREGQEAVLEVSYQPWSVHHRPQISVQKGLLMN